MPPAFDQAESNRILYSVDIAKDGMAGARFTASDDYYKNEKRIINMDCIDW